jgi:hypothetical protein
MAWYLMSCTCLPPEVGVQAAAKQWLLDGHTKARKLAQLVFGGSSGSDDDIEAHNTRSHAANARFIVNCSLAGEHSIRKIYTTQQWAAWVAGLAAGTPTLMATRDGYDYIVGSEHTDHAWGRGARGLR